MTSTGPLLRVKKKRYTSPPSFCSFLFSCCSWRYYSPLHKFISLFLSLCTFFFNIYFNFASTSKRNSLLAYFSVCFFLNNFFWFFSACAQLQQISFLACVCLAVAVAVFLFFFLVLVWAGGCALERRGTPRSSSSSSSSSSILIDSSKIPYYYCFSTAETPAWHLCRFSAHLFFA